MYTVKKVKNLSNFALIQLQVKLPDSQISFVNI